MIPAVCSGLAAMAADDGVASTTTTSRLRAVVAERVMATVAGGTTATSLLRAAAAEREKALAFDGGVAAIAADGQWRRSVWWVFRAHPTGTPRALHYAGDYAATAM